MDVDLAGAKSVLIVKPSSLGDVAHTIPAVGAIARAYPDLELRWVVNPEWAPLIEGLPWLMQAVPFPRSEFRGAAGLARFFSWRHELRQSMPAPGIALDFQGLLRSGLVAKWSGAPVRIGLSDSREGAWIFHSHAVEVDPRAHAVDRYLALPRALGIDVPGTPSFELPPGEPVPGEWLSGANARECVLLHPFSRGRGKSFSPGQVAALCRELGSRTVVIVGKGDAIRELPPNALDLLNRTTLPQLIWLSRRAGFVVSVDSGPMHIAAAVNARLLGIHTWSDPRKVGPYQPEAWVFKGGAFFHRSDCPDALRTAEAPLLDEHIPAIARFVVEKIACF